MSAGAACVTRPTRSSGRAGLRTSLRAAPQAVPEMSGPASHEALRKGARAASTPATVRGSVRSHPFELRRAGMKRAAGGAMRGFATAAPSPSTAATGSRAISSAVTLSSTIWFTNELLAPFSSRRRTR